MSTTILKIAIISAIGFFVIKVFKLKILTDIKNLAYIALFKKFKRDSRKYSERSRLRSISREKKTLFNRYYFFVEDLLIQLKFGITVENFNTILTGVYIGSIIVLSSLLGNIFLAMITSLPVIVSIIAGLVALARLANKSKTEKVMDAVDMLCPMVSAGIAEAIKKAIPAIDPGIRPFFIRFIDQYEIQGYKFSSAMDILERSLGRNFSSFATKAKNFEYNERLGMVDIFNDIVDDNALLREVNIRKNIAFRKINNDLLMKIVILIVFTVFMLQNNTVKTFLLETFLGKLVISGIVMCICIIFVLNQKVQEDIEHNK